MTDTSITWLPVRRKARVEIYRGGARTLPDINTAVPLHHGRVGGNRGRIDGLSLASIKRLRLALLTKSVPGMVSFGLTLTLPGKVDSGSQTDSCFRDALNHFGVLFRRRFPEGGIIYRVELQERKAPHLHCVVWVRPIAIPELDEMFSRPLVPLRCDYVGHEIEDKKSKEKKWVWIVSPEEAALKCPFVTSPRPYQPASLIDTSVLRASDAVFDLWFRAVDAHFDFASENDGWYFHLHGGRCTVFAEDGGIQSALKYLCDDISHRKQAQLGYQGKQWGFIGRSNFVQVSPLVVGHDRDYWNMAKWVGRIRSQWVKKDEEHCRRNKKTGPLPAQCRQCTGRCRWCYRERRIYAGISYLLPSTIKRLADFFGGSGDA